MPEGGGMRKRTRADGAAPSSFETGPDLAFEGSDDDEPPPLEVVVSGEDGESGEEEKRLYVSSTSDNATNSCAGCWYLWWHDNYMHGKLPPHEMRDVKSDEVYMYCGSCEAEEEEVGGEGDVGQIPPPLTSGVRWDLLPEGAKEQEGK